MTDLDQIKPADWAQIGLALTAIATFIFSMWRYLVVRWAELRWQRTEFLFEQARYLDLDVQMNYAVAMLDGSYRISLNEVFDENGRFLSEVDGKYKHGLDKLFNLLDRLAWAYFENNVISKSELVNFGWYYHKILKHNRVVKYCEKHGYKDVIKLAQKLQ